MFCLGAPMRSAGPTFDKLHEAVEREFLSVDEQRRAFAWCWRSWRADSSAASWNFSMNEVDKPKDANEETAFSRQVGAQAARKLKGAARSRQEHLVWPGHVRVDRLVGDGSDPHRRGGRPMGGQQLSEYVFMDAECCSSLF